MMNVVNSLPIPVIPIDRDRADYALSKNRLGDYFIRNPGLLRLAMQPEHTEQAVRMAAHACGLWFEPWQNPESGRRVMVVASKEVMPLGSLFRRTLQNAAVLAALKRRSG